MKQEWKKVIAFALAAVMLASTVVFATDDLPQEYISDIGVAELETIQSDAEHPDTVLSEEAQTGEELFFEEESAEETVINLLADDFSEDVEQMDIVRDFVDTEDITGISDEVFYGEYDGANGIWIQEGYFDYDAHPEMSEIKAAVMEANGDYTEVKEAVLQYYYDKRNGYKLSPYGSTGVQQVFLAQALERDLYPHLSWKVLGFQELTAEPQYVDFDVSYTWPDIADNAGKQVTFYIMATRKDGTMAELDSHEASHPPVLEVESNGVVTTFTATDDATMIAGSNAAKKYGTESTLQIEESVTSIGKSDPTDSNTKRALVKFDLSSLNMEDTVTRATLKLYGRNATNDDAKEIIVMKATTDSWSEETVTFANYEHMAYSWDGEGCIQYITPKYSGHRYREELQRFESVYPLIGGMFVKGEVDQEYYAYIALKIWCGFLLQSGRDPYKPPADSKSHEYASMGGANIITLLSPNEVTGSEDLPFRDTTLFDQVEEVALYLAKMSAPGFKDNQWGDGSANTVGYLKTIENWNKRYNNPYLNYYTGDVDNGEPFPFTSCKYDSERRMVLRSGWGDNDVYLYTDMDGDSVSHAHKDDNSIILSAYGKYLLADPLYASYSDETAKFGSTAFHNTVEIDGQSHKGGGKGDIRYWETNDIYDHTSNWAKTYRSNGINEWHARNILYIRPGFFLVSDYLKPNDTDTASHTYRQRWIMPPDADMTIDADTMTARSNTAATANIQVVQADKTDITLEKVNDRYITTYTDRAVYTKKGSGAVLFDTVLYPEEAGANVEVTSARIALENVTNNGASAVQIAILDKDTQKKSDISYYLVHDMGQKAVRRFGDYETDARLAYVERDGSGKLARLIIQDGTYIKDIRLNKDLFRSQEPVEQFGCHLQYSLMELATSAEIALDKLTVLADTGGKVEKVEFNGEKQGFKKSGRYVYFGSTPILEDEEKPEPTPTPGSSGGGSGGGGLNPPGSVGFGGKTGDAVAPPTESQPPQPPEIPNTQLQEQIKGHWAEKEIADLIRDGIVQGDNGSLNLEEPVTRAEFAAMLIRSLGIEPEEYLGGVEDISAQDWFADIIQACVSHNIMNGSDGMMRPNDWITREEMAKMVVSALGQMESDTKNTLAFSDSNEISDWAAEYVAQAVDKGLLNGFEDGSFRPSAQTLREQAMVVAARLRGMEQSQK